MSSMHAAHGMMGSIDWRRKPRKPRRAKNYCKVVEDREGTKLSQKQGDETMTTSTSITLSPAQFSAARALAAAHYHLWAGVPTGTFNLADIEAYGEAEQHP